MSSQEGGAWSESGGSRPPGGRRRRRGGKGPRRDSRDGAYRQPKPDIGIDNNSYARTAGMDFEVD